MLDQFKNLSAQQIARLIQYAEGGSPSEQIDGAKLHAEKNAPWVNGAYSHLRFPPPARPGDPDFQAYPKVLFSAEYTRADEQYRNALRLRARRGMEDEAAVLIADASTTRDGCMRWVNDAAEEAALGASWQETPAKALAMRETLDRAVAQAAAESNYDDRRMGTLAKAERDAADAASPEHLVELPRTPIPTHQKKKDA